jgi:hypothetical protein
MRAFALASLLVVSAVALEAPAFANDGIYLPSGTSGVGGEDSIETAEGTRCRQSMNNNGAYVDMGVVGTAAKQSPYSNSYLTTNPSSSAVAYARVTIPLGSKPKRLDCTKLYDLEITRLRREIELLKLAAE